ncbi:unnamed protein product [Phytomonas sp. Hart1]|nr:unnamed protein product [Phytomonas sp. Hart1]|eukprot:CCW67475.1 unnamed protein product [Phytomonas sp. isolate Hart1]
MNEKEKKQVQINVPSDDPKSKEVDKKSKDGEVKLSEEDERIKEQVEFLVSRSADRDLGIAKIAINQLADLLRTSSSGSVASVPKPLKYVRTLFPELEQILKDVTQDFALQRRLHDVLSFVSMTIEHDKGTRPSLAHKLKGTLDDLAEWGHEYLRFLAGEIAAEWEELIRKHENINHLSNLVDQITQYMIAHQDEPTCMDLLIEINDVKRILGFVDSSNYKRVANYLSAVSHYLTRPADTEALSTVFNIYTKVGACSDAVVIALKLGSHEKVDFLFKTCTNKALRLQMALTCARHRYFIDFDAEEDELLQEANGNMRISQLFRSAAQELDAIAPKTPDEVIKNGDSSNEPPRDSLQNLTNTFVSGLANCAFGKDKYLTESSTFLFDQKEDRIISTTAALGLLHLWDHMEGLQEIDKYFYSESNYIKSGACLASGIAMCGIKSPFDPALGLLSEHVNSPQKDVSIGAILGLGYAYSGMRKEDVKELLVPILADGEQLLEVQCLAAYALALVYVGSADEDITETMMNCLLEIPDKKLTETCVRFLILALGCMFLGCQEGADTLLDATQALSPIISQYADTVIRSCAFAATGNVITIQKFFHIIAENDDPADDDPNEDSNKQNEEKHDDVSSKTLNFKAAAVLGIGLVALGEELGAEMAKRAIIHALLADTVSKKKDAMSGRRAVPLVYALLSASNPSMPVVESLNRLAHDSDISTAMNAVLGMGLVAAGSNNARVAGKLRNIAQYYQRSRYNNTLFTVRLAQGLCAMGKGHLALSPLQNDRLTVNHPALMGLLTLLHCALDLNNTVLDKYHYMVLAITPSITPRMVLAVDEKMEPVEGIQVRVGLPVDTVALPGKPKTITGFQTHTTPVLLASTDKVELADLKYRSIPSIVEGVFVVEQKPVID